MITYIWYATSVPSFEKTTKEVLEGRLFSIKSFFQDIFHNNQ